MELLELAGRLRARLPAEFRYVIDGAARRAATRWLVRIGSKPVEPSNTSTCVNGVGDQPMHE